MIDIIVSVFCTTNMCVNMIKRSKLYSCILHSKCSVMFLLFPFPFPIILFIDKKLMAVTYFFKENSILFQMIKAKLPLKILSSRNYFSKFSVLIYHAYSCRLIKTIFLLVPTTRITHYIESFQNDSF